MDDHQRDLGSCHWSAGFSLPQPEACTPNIDWEAAWAPYDEATYRAALDLIEPDDVVLDIGAGDLRFARRAAQRARSVIAIERCAKLLKASYPDNMSVMHEDALHIAFPSHVTVGVLLMRHCQHFAEYAAKLRVVGCKRLITNARWGMDVELAALDATIDFASAAPGWYACQCGAVGFKPCLPDQLTATMIASTANVASCPSCNRSTKDTKDH